MICRSGVEVALAHLEEGSLGVQHFEEIELALPVSQFSRIECPLGTGQDRLSQSDDLGMERSRFAIGLF